MLFPDALPQVILTNKRKKKRTTDRKKKKKKYISSFLRFPVRIVAGT